MKFSRRVHIPRYPVFYSTPNIQKVIALLVTGNFFSDRAGVRRAALTGWQAKNTVQIPPKSRFWTGLYCIFLKNLPKFAVRHHLSGFFLFSKSLAASDGFWELRMTLCAPLGCSNIGGRTPGVGMSDLGSDVPEGVRSGHAECLTPRFFNIEPKSRIRFRILRE